MLKYVVAIVLIAMLLTGGAPWAGPVGTFGSGDLVGAMRFEGGLLEPVAALLLTLLALVFVGGLLVTVLGTALLVLLGLPLFLLLAVAALILAPILLPLLLVLMLATLVLKGIGLALA